tara:strand:+ start:431 stop:1081 length:651 start_codon:yes stop_codon:yes gene_type:complete
MIQFNNVTATYTKEVGLFDVSFSVAKGELVFLMGPTGAGKSTLLKSIYADIPINSGDLLINNINISKIKKRNIPYFRRKIGMIFQDYRLLNDRTVFENISLPLKILGESKKYIYNEVNQIIEKVGLENNFSSFPSDLSGGQKQRVAIARALVKKPFVILADEPTGNLDPNISDDIIDLLELATNNGTSVIMTTHNFPLVKPRRKRFIELNKGRVVG